ncbi:MAG: class I SAM-dependent methyltransferase, partial [Oscillochloris sp.]|nr:class I SAM-dependent methyltransferase [Oscillochloris sp.]
MQHLATLHAPYAELLRAALELASPSGGRIGLDLGCGPGLKADWLAARLAPVGLLLGLDIARAALAAAPRAARRAWLVGDAHALPLADASVDLSWCVAAQELLTPPARALAEARRVLRPPGALVVAVVRQLWVRPRPWPPAVAAAWEDRA